MKRKTFIISVTVIIILILVGYIKKDRSIVSGYYRNGQPEMVFLTEKNLKGEKIIRQLSFYKNGQTSSEGLYINGKKHGQWLKYHRDGRVKEEEIYSQGKLVRSKIYNEKKR